MKIIFIRGLPGTGKTPLAHNLEKTLLNSEVIHLDDFGIKKTKINDENYEKISKKLYSLYSKKVDPIIIEGIICKPKLYEIFKKFSNETNSEMYSFKIEKPLNELLNKNTKEELIRLDEEMNNCKIDNEYTLKQGNFVEEILEIINF